MKHLFVLLVLSMAPLPAVAQTVTLTPEERQQLRDIKPLIDRLSADPLPQPTVTPLPATATMAEVQAAFDTAQPSDIIELAPGQTYVGNWVLNQKLGTVVVRGCGAELRSPTSEPVVRTAANGDNWRFEGCGPTERLKFSAANPAGTLVRLGSAVQTAAEIPRNHVFRQVWLAGDPVQGGKRGIEMNSINATLTESLCTDIKRAGMDTQCVVGWNGPGPYVITNSHLEAAGEVIMFGGADPSIPGMLPADILIDNNTLTRPMAWKGSTWTIKNIFELKAALRVTFTNNDLSNNWLAAQTGYAILLKSVNQDGTQTWAEVRDVVIRGNRVTNVSSVLNIAPNPGHPGVPFSGLVVEDNYFETNRVGLGGDGRCLMQQGVQGVVFARNTCKTDGDIAVFFDAGPTDMRIEGNIFVDGAYGLKGTGQGEGNATINYYVLGGFTGNMVVSPGSPQLYPTSNGNVVVASWPTDPVGFGSTRQ
jgi:hypothetical protein